jgi:uncharacterized protein YbjQ (UPF0145 family)
MEWFIGIIFALLLLAFAGWRWLTSREERWRARYSQQLGRRESELTGMIADAVGLFRDGIDEQMAPSVVIGQSVLWTPYFNSVFPDTSSRHKINCEQQHGELCRLARREAVVRLLESARDAGFNAVCDIHIDSADIGHTLNASQRAMVVITAVGTGYRVAEGVGVIEPSTGF